MITTLGLLVIGFSVFYFVIAYIKRAAKHQQEIKIKEIEHQAELFRSVVESQEEERRIIGKELHDEVSSVLYAIRLRLKNNLTPENESNLQAVEKIISITRNISHLLSPPEIEILGFHDSLLELCNANSNKDLKIELKDDSYGLIPKSQFQVSLMLYRIFQELITNTIKHARASIIQIQLSNHDGVLHISYKDNGIGLDPNRLNKSTLGFNNIISRLMLIKATYNMKNENGFCFEIFLDTNQFLSHG